VTLHTIEPSSQRILHKALELFSLKGYDATSVREICEASGITKPTLYHFFKSKEGVYRALVEGSLEQFHASIFRELEREGSAALRLKRMASTYFRTGLEHRDVVRFIFGLIHNPPSAAPVTDFPRFYQDLVDRVAAVVEAGVASGELAPGPIDVRMLVLMGALGEALCGYLIIGTPELTDDLAASLVETVLSGWRPGAQGKTQA
jgi:TetR/AcrR family transcriptional regulator